MESIKRIHTAETDSTNRLLRNYQGEEGLLMTVATCDYQTAGRGQGHNTWESEPGMNLLLSAKTHPANLPACRQYAMTEAVALAVVATLNGYADGFCVKWPNDVYYRDMKISGTLSECDIRQSLITTCILGTGINVNQQRFVSDAPNPVSLRLILGHDTDRRELLDRLLEHMSAYINKVNAGQLDELHDEYSGALYRREGLHAYRDDAGEFVASIEAVASDGRLILRREDGRCSRYEFKEVKFIIDNK